MFGILQVYAVGLAMAADEIAAIEGRMDTEVVEDRGEAWLTFVDRYGVRWQLSTDAPFMGAGEATGRWLDV